jgi:nitrile hydratase subunit alpha
VGTDHDHGAGGSHDDGPSPLEARVAALEAALVERGLISSDTIEAVVQAFEHEIGPHLGARVVARAWIDPDYRERLLDEGTAAVAELGIGGVQGAVIRVVENTPEQHNVVVCTLCSCYPWPLLGLPPTWYKSPPYRSRVVREPRAVLAEMGLDLPPSTRVRVWDSTSEVRYLVLPQRPAGTEGWDEERLAGLVPRDAMIGVAEADPPGPGPSAGAS